MDQDQEIASTSSSEDITLNSKVRQSLNGQSHSTKALSVDFASAVLAPWV